VPVKVVDASAAAALLFVEAEAPSVVEALGDADLVAPTLLNYELANVCLTKIRARPAEREALVQAFAAIDDLAIRIVEVAHRRVLDLAEQTLDKRLATAARKLAVHLR
jgi:predicted nucleic acid-binding protein